MLLSRVKAVVLNSVQNKLKKRLVHRNGYTRISDNQNEKNPNLVIPHEIDANAQWSISSGLTELLSDIVIKNNITNVLEFGAGRSSLVIAKALLASKTGKLTSVEQNAEWCYDIWLQVREMTDVDAELVISSPAICISKKGIYYSYTSAKSAISRRGPFEMVFIDAPQGYYGRIGTLHLAYPYLKPGAIIVLDDAGRGGEQLAVYRWLCTYCGLELQYFDPMYHTKGVVVLKYNGNKEVNYLVAGLLIDLATVLRLKLIRRSVRDSLK